MKETEHISLTSPFFFENTEIAFSHKNNRELKTAFRIFSLMQFQLIVKAGIFFTKLAIKLNFPIQKLIRRTLYHQFCGGKNIESCRPVFTKLAEYNIKSVPAYAVEDQKNETDFKQVLDKIITILQSGKEDKNIVFCELKPTSIGSLSLFEKVSSETSLSTEEKVQYEALKNRLDIICQTANECGVPVLIDAEESWMHKAVDDLCAKMMKKHNQQKAIVYNTYQMYRTDMLESLKQAYKNAYEEGYCLGVKLVRGAYLEKEIKRAVRQNKPSPVYKSKSDTDKNYNRAIRFCLENITKIALFAGTHNEESCLLSMNLMQELHIEKTHPHVYFSQLYGMSDHITYNLSDAGYNVAKYIPYGPLKDTIPYLLRRAEENRSIIGQVSREYILLKKEIERRKKLIA